MKARHTQPKPTMIGNCGPAARYDAKLRALIMTNDADDFYFYGFESRDELDQYIEFLTEARDHYFPALIDPMTELNARFAGKRVTITGTAGGSLEGLFQKAVMKGSSVSVLLGVSPEFAMTIHNINPANIHETVPTEDI